jgi:hypothetical protein
VSFFDTAFRLWREPRVRLPLAILAFAAVTLVTALIAHPRMFTGFMAYDDEGYMLTALRGFVNHGHLYDDVFSQYGPFYYEAWGGLFSTFGIPVTLDGGRAVTMVAWIVSSLAVGMATMRIAGSLLLGLGTQVLVFSALGVAANEPMHPGGIICLLLAAIVVVSCFVRDRVSPYAMATLGGVVAALVLVKINVGFFALASVAFACVVSYPALCGRRWLRIAAEAAFVAIPVLLMLSKFDEGWARHYAIHVAVAALALVIVLRAREGGRRSSEELAWLLGGFALVFVFVCVAIAAAGTSFDGLLEGVIRQPLRQADAFTIPLQLSRQVYAFDLMALAGAVAYWYASRRRPGSPGPTWIALASLLSIAVGVAMALSVNGKLVFVDVSFSGFQFSMLAFAWVALIAVPGEDRPGAAFARLLLPLLTVLGALHAFPVAGSQTLWSTFLLIPVGALCIANGARGLATVVEDRTDRRALGALGALAALMLALFVANTYLRRPYDNNRAAFASGIELDLPGAESIRLGQQEVDRYRKVTGAIDRNCTSLLMLPGMDSFYVWTELEPPSYTATGWPTLFDDEHQRRVIDDTASIEGLCLLRDIPLAAGWGGGEIPPGPLVGYLERGFQPLAKFGDYELLRREGAAGAAS